jgi:hypothetical protein
VRDAALKVQDGFMRKDQAIKIQYASKYASVANYWKKWIGESKGLKKSNAVEVKQKFETDFQQKVIKAGKEAAYGNLLRDFEKNYAEIKDYALARDLFTEVALRNTEILQNGYRLYQLEQVLKTKGEQAFTDRKNNLSNGLTELVESNTGQRFLNLRKSFCQDPKLKNMLTSPNTERNLQDIVLLVRRARTYYNQYLKTLNK